MKRSIPVSVLLILVIFGIGLASCRGPLESLSSAAAPRAAAGDVIVWNGDSDKAAAVDVDAVKSARTNASGPKITSNAHSADFPGIYFIWDSKQKDSGYLKVSSSVFDIYKSFILTSKEANTYWDFVIQLQAEQEQTEDGCYVFFISRAENNKNINMVFIGDFELLPPPPYAYIPSGDTPLKDIKRLENLSSEVGWSSTGNAVSAGRVSADDPAGSIFHGLYSSDLTGANAGRKFYFYVSPTVRYRQGQVLITMPSTDGNGDRIDVRDFLYDSGWLKIADDKRMSLLVAEAGPEGWKADESAYINAVYSFMSGRTYLHTENHAWYLVGYGDGANAIAYLAMVQQSNLAGAAIFGADDFNTSFFSAGNVNAPVVRNAGYPNRQKKEFPLPMWIGAVERTESVDALMDYWRASNLASVDASGSVPFATEVWEPLYYRDESYNINDVQVSRVLLTLGDMNYVPFNKAMTEYLWYNFLQIQRRVDMFQYFSFQPFYHVDEYWDTHSVRAHDNISTNTLREYFVYVPESAKGKAPGTVPMMVVSHGANQSGADQPTAFSRMDKVAKENGFIIVSPTGSRGTGYKATCSPSVTVDYDFWRKMIDKVLVDYPQIDRSRMYLSGHSMGCSITTAWAAFDTRFAAIASYSFTANATANGGSIGTSSSGVVIRADRTVIMPIMLSLGQWDTQGGANGNTTGMGSISFTQWYSQNSVTNTARNDSNAFRIEGRPYPGPISNDGPFTVNLSGWTWYNEKSGDTPIPVVRFQWTWERQHATLPQEAASCWDFLKHYSRDPVTLQSYYDGIEILK